MKRIIKWLKRGLLAVAVVLVLVLAIGLTYREIVQTRTEAAMVLDEPNAIDEELFVTAGGAEQWVSIRGRDRRNPVVLMVHGGPGSGNGPMLAAFAPLEQRYTLVQWDQPGAGKTFRRGGNSLPAELTIDGIVADGIEISELVRKRLGVEQLILLGWSWGTIVGMEMARDRPDLFAAYVGTGQFTSIAPNEAAVYSMALASGQRLGDSNAVRELEAIGAPPYASFEEFSAARAIAADLGKQPSIVELMGMLLVAPRHSLLDVASYIRGALASGTHFVGAAMDGPILAVDLPATVPALEVPVVFIQGADDDVTPAALARNYFDRLTSPRKTYVALEGAGHAALIEDPEAFLAALEEHVRPLISAE